MYTYRGLSVDIDYFAPQSMLHMQRVVTNIPHGWFGGLLSQQQTPAGDLYMRNRYYDPMQGRFTQVDPIGLAGGLNAYGFANGDPVNYDDPFGLTSWWTGLLVRATMAVASATANTVDAVLPPALQKAAAESGLTDIDQEMLKTVKEAGVEIAGKTESRAAIEGAATGVAKAGVGALTRGAAREGTSFAVKGVIGLSV